MTTEPVFLSMDDVLEIHARQLKEYGGSGGIRDKTLLESAVAVPKSSFGGSFVHDGEYAMAAAYAFHIAQNQPFVDGNKRTGLVAALVFLDLNGTVVLDPEGKLYDALIAIAERRMTKEQLAALLRELPTGPTGED